MANRDVLRRICEANFGAITLKCEQRQSIIFLQDGKDVFAVLPNRFGKSLMYQSYAFANVRNGRPPILVIIPQWSIVHKQLGSNEFELKAVDPANSSRRCIEKCP